jgi:hypothetical protein
MDDEHEFPMSNAKRFPFMVQGDDGWWHWPDPTNTMPLLFSIKATKEGGSLSDGVD